MALRFVDLKRKYAEIRRLRLEQDQRVPGSMGHDPRPALARLASEFPGALRELDALPFEAIETRLAELERAEADETFRPAWMTAQIEYHSLARGALAAKRFLAGARHIDESTVTRFHAHAESSPSSAELLVWSSDLHTIASPPRGRLSTAVFAKLSDRLGTTPTAARELVFPKIDCG